MRRIVCGGEWRDKLQRELAYDIKQALQSIRKTKKELEILQSDDPDYRMKEFIRAATKRKIDISLYIWETAEGTKRIRMNCIRNQTRFVVMDILAQNSRDWLDIKDILKETDPENIERFDSVKKSAMAELGLSQADVSHEICQAFNKISRHSPFLNRFNLGVTSLQLGG